LAGPRNQILMDRFLRDFQQDCFSCRTFPKFLVNPKRDLFKNSNWTLGVIVLYPEWNVLLLTEPRAWLYCTPSEISYFDLNLGRDLRDVTICQPI
jgi:hypothetical protein